MDISPSLPCLRVFHQFAGIAGTPCVGDQIAAVVYHITVGSDDCQRFRYILHSRRIERTVKTLGRFDRPLCRMIGPEVDQPHIRIILLDLLYRRCRQEVKAAIPANGKLPYSILGNMPFCLPDQLWKQAIRRIPVTNKKTGISVDKIVP